MDDKRQKLFPIFLKEAECNLQILRRFFGRQNLSVASAEELETAFRAVHALKGTAALVQAESICTISRRLETLLGKHLSAQTLPTVVEHEAIRLAVDWLAPLLSALQGDLQEPKLFVTEALQALDLAAAFPGRTPLVELLDSCVEQRPPQLDDPFDSDPALLPDEDEILRAARDPFADDPAFGMGIDPVRRGVNTESSADSESSAVMDPFADDHDFSFAPLWDELPVAAAEMTEFKNNVEQPVTVGGLPYDPFAEDSLGLEVDSVSETWRLSGSVDSWVSSSSNNDVKDTAAAEEESGAGIDVMPVMIDPFAEDEDFTV